jgi:hypothetical protein
VLLTAERRAWIVANRDRLNNSWDMRRMRARVAEIEAEERKGMN